MAFSPTAFCDCQTIIKTYERGAIYCANTESVFAMLTPVLQNNRVNAQAFIEQSEIEENRSNPKPASEKPTGNDSPEQTAGGFYNMDKADQDDGGFSDNIEDNGTLTKESSSFNWQDCFPCDFRIKTLEEAIELSFSATGSSFLNAFEEMFKNALQQMEKIKQLFKGLDQYADLCVFLEWLKTFVCLPDLARILSALMAMLSRVSFDLGGSIGIILSLVTPLIQPFLSNLVASLEKALMLIIKPLECIIDALQRLISSLDVENVLDKNIDATQLSVKWRRQGPKIGEVKAHSSVSKLYNLFTKGDDQLAVDLHKGPSREIYNIDASFGYKEHLNAEKARKQQKVEQIQKEMEALDKASRNIDAADKSAIDEYTRRRNDVKTRYKEAIEERDLSKAQRINKRLSEGRAEFRQQFKSMILKLTGYLKQSIRVFEAFVNSLWDELKKLMLEFGGGQNSFIADLIVKAEILELVKVVYALIDVIKKGKLQCDEQEESAAAGVFLGSFSSQAGLTLWVDEDGNTHIEDDPEDIQDAIEEVVEAFGEEPSSPLANKEKIRQNDKGNYVTDAKDKLKSLIELTGDPLLDSQIARSTEAVLTRTQVTFKCPLQTSVANAEQVNKWIKELNQS